LDSDIAPTTWTSLALHPDHERAGEPDSVFARFAANLDSPALRRRIPLVFERHPLTGGAPVIGDGLQLLELLFRTRNSLEASVLDLRSTDSERSVDLLLDGGDDGQRPGAAEYEGTADDDSTIKTGLKGFEDIEDISIVAAPGSTFGYETASYRSDAATILNLLISHAERMRYRIAVLDSADGQTIADVRAMRGRLDSKYAAFYYPWIRILDPVTRQEIHVPPSGFVAGIYARNDVQRAVYKAPANEVVNLAIGFEQFLNKAQQEVLNPEGINCFRFFEGRGMRLWGARTISSDPEWKYVNLRRYFAYLERSIDKGTQWAVFEPNGEQLWANVRRTIEDFLLNEWQMGALLGDKPERAYFVKCDRSTMTQNDLDNGRLVCLIGVAPLRPAEFVIFRIGQWTADRKG
jgi:phage tail sheath protein FI